jgi:CubicO group peptidase (beta-lactamase class C family)
VNAQQIVRRALIIAACTVAQRSSAQTTWPTKQWPTATPQEVGIAKAVIDSIDSEIASGKYNYVDRMLVIRHGRVAFDRKYPQDYVRAYGDSVNKKNALNADDPTGPYDYFNDWWHPYYRRGDLHTLQSVTKTITSVILGVATTRGDFPSLDRPVLSFFDSGSVANVDDRKRRMTVKHLITMTAGIDWNEGLPYVDPRNTATGLEASHDWVKYTIDRPMMEEPGARFNYNSGVTQVVAYVFRRATGKDIEEYAAKYLFAPLGIERWFWKRTPAGLIDTEGGLYLEARDLAKIAYLFLHDGQWEGKQIVSREWVKNSVTPIIATSTTPNASHYGLAWWLHPTGQADAPWYWAGSGFGGQFPVIMTKQDMVVVFNGWNILPGKPGLPSRRIIDRLAAAASPK